MTREIACTGRYSMPRSHRDVVSEGNSSRCPRSLLFAAWLNCYRSLSGSVNWQSLWRDRKYNRY